MTVTVAYFDTSALVPLLISEPSTRPCARAWDNASTVTTTEIAYVEVHAALAQAARHGRLDAAEHREALASFETIWEDIARVPVDSLVIGHAATLAATQALRGYDAVHCATALAVASDDFVAVAGDRRLLEAWRELGVATIDTAR